MFSNSTFVIIFVAHNRISKCTHGAFDKKLLLI